MIASENEAFAEQELGGVMDQVIGELGVLLQKELARLGWSQGELARATGLMPSTISKIVRGITRPEVDTLQRIAKALGIDINKLVEALNADILSERERNRLDAIPDEEIDAFLAALREEIEEDKSRTLIARLKKFLDRRRASDAS